VSDLRPACYSPISIEKTEHRRITQMRYFLINFVLIGRGASQYARWPSVCYKQDDLPRHIQTLSLIGIHRVLKTGCYEVYSS
jgi:hypothetical protein